MAFGNNKARQAPAREPETKRQPDYVVRAKVGDFWVTIGASWIAQLKDGEGLSVKINMVPTGWNGDCLMMPPLKEGS